MLGLPICSFQSFLLLPFEMQDLDLSPLLFLNLLFALSPLGSGLGLCLEKAGPGGSELDE